MASPRVRQILHELLYDVPGSTNATGARALERRLDGAGAADDLLQRLCAATTAAVSVDGTGLALMTQAGHAGLLAASDGRAVAMEDLQHSLGEGPCLEASAQGRPVLQPDLRATGRSRWPAFTASAVEGGIAAVFAFPLHVGAIRLGVLDLYRSVPGSLDSLEIAEALDFATAATTILLDLQSDVPAGQLHPLLAEASENHRAIHQATGMVSVQAAVGLTEALLLLRGRAFATGRLLIDVATDVVERKLHFDLEPVHRDGPEKDEAE